MFPDLPRSTGKIGQKAKTAPMGPHAILAGPVRFELLSKPKHTKYTVCVGNSVLL